MRAMAARLLNGPRNRNPFPHDPDGPRMSYRGSLLARIAGTVLIAFAWFAFLLFYLMFFPASSPAAELTVPLLAGLADAATIGVLWLIWFLRDRRAF